MRFRRTSRCISISIWRGPRKGFLTSGGYNRWAVDGGGERRFRERRGVKGGRRWGEEERGRREGGATCGGKRVLGRVSLSTGTACRRIGDCPPIHPNAQAPTPNSNLGTGVYTDWLFCRYGLSTEAHCRDHLLSGRCARSSFAASGCYFGPDYPRSSFFLHALYGSAMPEPVSCWRTAVARFIRKAERMDEWEKGGRGAWERVRRSNGGREC